MNTSSSQGEGCPRGGEIAPKGEPGVPDLAPWVLHPVETPKLYTDDPVNSTSVHSSFNECAQVCRTGFASGGSIFSQQVGAGDKGKPGRSTSGTSCGRCQAQA